MHDTEHLTTLIGDVYDAALDPVLWENAIADVARFVGGPATALWSKAASGDSGDFACVSGFDFGYVRAFLDHYITLDPAANKHFFAGIGEPVAQAALVPADEFRASRFYREWAQPQGFVDCVNVTLEKSATGLTLFGVARHARDGVADGDTHRRMRFMAPHLRRAVLIGKSVDLQTAEAASFADTLDGLGDAMFLVDVGGRLVHANRAGYRVLADGRMLRTVDGQLCARDPAADRALRDIIMRAASGDAALDLRGIALPITGPDGDHHVAHALPLTSGARRRTGRTWSAVVAIFLRRSALDLPSAPEVIARHYKLTPTELRVLLAMVEIGGGVPDVADALGIAASTVRTHLARLYEKTGTRRQADLVKLLAGFATPLAD